MEVLEIADQERLIHDLRQIYRMLSSGLPVILNAVMPVVEFVGWGAAIDLEKWLVERVGDGPEYRVPRRATASRKTLDVCWTSAS